MCKQRVAHPNAPQRGPEETTPKVTPFLLAFGRDLKIGDHAKGVVELHVWICIDVSFESTIPCSYRAERVSTGRG